jgi:hypothetical protein
MGARILLLAALAALVPGCKKATSTPAAVSSTPGAGGLPADHPPVDLPPSSRGPRRLDVDQLMATIKTVANPESPNPDAGPITWNYATSTSMLKTMGKPDYIYVTDEDLTPSTLYMKFAGDIANDVCGKMLQGVHRGEVLMKDVATTDTLQTNPTAVKAHLRWLYLRFFGRYVADDDEATIQPLLTVFDQVVQAAQAPDSGVSASNAAVEGWRAVCVASFTSPDFHLY